MHHQHCGHEHGHGEEEHCHHHEHHGGGHEHDHEPEQECDLEIFFCLAKQAWKKLMIEKIKAEMERMEGEKLNRLAKLIAETKFKKFHAKMEKMKAMHAFKEQLGQILCDGNP